MVELLIVFLAIIIFFLLAMQNEKSHFLISLIRILGGAKSNKGSKKVRSSKRLDKDRTIQIITPKTTKDLTDDSLIDVTGKAYRLQNSETRLNKYFKKIPFWNNKYVYSHTEIDYATDEQKAFYEFYKTRFLLGMYFDLEGNSNYAFILLFDLLNEYENHKDIKKLEIQLSALGQNYPPTKSYAVSFLIKKMELIGDIDAIRRIEQENNQHYTDYSHWKLGVKYKNILNLNDEEVSLLNRLSNINNSFFNIDFCAHEIIKLYLSLQKELKENYALEETTLEKQFEIVADVIARKQYRYRKGSDNYKYCLETAVQELNTCVYRYCENTVRDIFCYKRKLNTEIYSGNQFIRTEYEQRITSKISEILPTLVKNIRVPNEDVEIELNTIITNRWKTKFEELMSSYNQNPKFFLDQIIELGRLNKTNPAVENIFFDASKFMSKIHKETALILYIYYLYHDLQSVTFDNKQLSKTIQKNLFTSNEQLHIFEKIVSELIIDKNLEKALKAIPKVYLEKRRKIQLNTSSIKEVQSQHFGTVELLNEYLKDEYDDERNSIRSQEINNEELKIEITLKSEQNDSVLLTNCCTLSHLDLITLEVFAKNNYVIEKNDFGSFAKSNGVFTNQLIESINEKCFELLDDVLIEEVGDDYTINPNYYERIFNYDQQS
ncbi:MAG: hypothetical protein LWX56_12615 [Ignavibacteria bacterium]|nr:hypothetical protein [Ignavibacteria bacterium]